MTIPTVSKPTDASTVQLGSVEPRRGLHGKVLDQIGLAICGGALASGSIIKISDLEEKYQVSRTVVRETIRVLESLGMVTSRRRLGVMVLAPDQWNLLDPQLIRWRLASNSRAAQLRSLTELRTAIEPEAARLAASRASLVLTSELMGLAGKLWAAGESGDQERFLELDIAFHRIVLESSGNEVFVRLNSVVTEALAGRTAYGLMPTHPHSEALQLHVDVASAIQRGDSVGAQTAMLAIMQRTIAEMSSIWSETDGDGAEHSSAPASAHESP